MQRYNDAVPQGEPAFHVHGTIRAMGVVFEPMSTTAPSTDNASENSSPLEPITAPKADQPLAIGGLFELTIGVADVDAALAFWSRFGYRAGLRALLSADVALERYGVASSAQVLRLAHGNSDHGLIRLVQWEKPLSAGVGVLSLRALGSRWGAALTTDVTTVLSHCELAAESGAPITVLPSVRQDPRGPAASPFLEPHVFVREMVAIRPESRQVLFQRFGYTNPSYGALEEAAFPTSQVTHVGLVTQGDTEQIYFYEQALGLLCTRTESVSLHTEKASQQIFDLAEGERYRCWDFDDPRSSPDPAKWLSGRLKFIHFDAGVPLDDVRALSQFGHLGHSAYSWRVRNLAAAVDSVVAHGGAVVGSPGLNEFGEPTVRFIAPDGYDWLLIESGLGTNLEESGLGTNLEESGLGTNLEESA
jgi:hypothetical protein